MYFIKEEEPNYVEFLNYFSYGVPIPQSPLYIDWHRLYGKSSFDIYTIYDDKEKKQIGYFHIFYFNILSWLKIGYVPYGPVLKKCNPKILITIKDFLSKQAKKQKLAFIRLDFTFNENISYLHLFFTRIPKYHPISLSYMQVRAEWFLNLNNDIDSIFQKMHKNTRYSIKSAHKRGIEVKIVDTPEILNYFDEFMEVMNIMAQKKRITLANREYYSSIFKYLSEFSTTKYWLAISKYGGKNLAFGLFIVYDNVAHYFYGCSREEEKTRFPMYALIWESIKLAKELKCNFFNLGSISTDKFLSTADFHGLTSFKKKFGGEEVIHENLVDIPINQFKYKIYNLAKHPLIYNNLQKIIKLIKTPKCSIKNLITQQFQKQI